MPGVGSAVAAQNPAINPGGAQTSNRGSQDPKIRPAEGKVTAAAQPGNTGPQSKQESNPFSTQILRFPDEIGTRSDKPKMLHWIKFIPCVQQKSSFSVQTTNELSSADINAGAAGTLIGSANPFGAANSAAIAGGLAVLGSAEAAVGAAKSIAGASGAKGVESAITKAIGDSVGSAVGGIASGAIVSAINLSRKTRRAAAYICLYMPDTINQQLVNDYDQVSLTQALGKTGLVQAAGGSIKEQLSGIVSGNQMLRSGLAGSAGQKGDVSKGGLAEVGGLIAEKTGNFGAGIGDVLLFSAGLAQNPQIELLFKSIQNREFTFDFKFVPKNQKDAAIIREIIKRFRFHAAPEIPTNSGGRYFIPPSEFDIQFMIGEQENLNIPKISTCALIGIDVNYGSAGQWTAFQDGMPVEISMQLRFKEVEILHKALIEKNY